MSIAYIFLIKWTCWAIAYVPIFYKGFPIGFSEFLHYQSVQTRTHEKQQRKNRIRRRRHTQFMRIPLYECQFSIGFLLVGWNVSYFRFGIYESTNTQSHTQTHTRHKTITTIANNIERATESYRIRKKYSFLSNIKYICIYIIIPKKK